MVRNAVEVLLGVIENRLADVQSRRGDGDVDAWAASLSLLSQTPDRRRACGVGDNRLGRAALFPNASHRRLGSAAVAVRANDSRAQGGQRLC